MEHHLIENYFKESNDFKKNGTVIECGAATGLEEPSVSLEYKYNWNFIGIEADVNQYQQLCHNRPNGKHINVGLSNYVGESNFYVSAHGNGGNSSINHNPIHVQELKNYPARINENIYNKTKIKVVDWNWIISHFNLSNVDLLILDIEGHEPLALDGISKTNVFPKVIQIEFGYSDYENKFLNPSKNQNFSGFIKIYNILIKMGYIFNYVNYNNAYFSHSSYWKNNIVPTSWKEENDNFVWNNICYYNKEECFKIINGKII